MPVPKFYVFLRPTLQVLSSAGGEHWTAVASRLATEFALSEDDLSIRTRGGTKTQFNDRVSWAHTYLREARLIESISRGKHQITNRGREFLGRCPETVHPADLMEFPEFADFQTRQRSPKSAATPVPSLITDGEISADPAGRTPQEQLEDAHEAIRKELAHALAERLREVSPKYFERIVVDLMLALGYGGTQAEAGATLGRTGDDGVDGVINEDILGLDKIYLQAKRWKAAVGAPHLRDFVGSLVGKNASKGVFMTTSTFTADGANYIRTVNHHVALIDGQRMAELMIDHDLGVATVETYAVKRIDSDYFEEA